MAFSQEILNGVTIDKAQDGRYYFWFPVALVIVYENLQDALVIARDKEISAYKKRYDDLDDNLGQSDIYQYFREQARIGAYFVNTSNSGGSGGDVTIVGDNVGLNKEETQKEVLSTLENIEQILLDAACMVGWCYIFTKTVTLGAGKQYIINEELILENGSEFIIELGGKLFLNL